MSITCKDLENLIIHMLDDGDIISVTEAIFLGVEKSEVETEDFISYLSNWHVLGLDK